jgi:hypothetical protein
VSPLTSGTIEKFVDSDTRTMPATIDEATILDKMKVAMKEKGGGG